MTAAEAARRALSETRLPSLPLILLLGLGLRIVWALLVGVYPVSDPQIYDVFARNIAFEGTYAYNPGKPVAYWPVGASAIYAGAYLLMGANAVAVVVVNLLASAVILWGTWDLGRRWFDEATGRLAALLLAVWPIMIQFTSTLASELPFIALLLAGLVAWDRAAAGTGLARRAAWTLLAGLFLAAATYVRPIALLIPAAFAVAAILRAPRRAGPTLLMAAAASAVIVVAVLPWSARNERVFGERVFISTNFWPNFWISNNRSATREYMRLPPTTEGMTEIERSDYLKELVLEDLALDPARFVGRVVWKALVLHNRETIGVDWGAPRARDWIGTPGVEVLKGLSTAWWYAVLLAALAGLILLARRIGPWTALLSPPVWLWLYITAVHAVILVADRFHMPANPFIAMLAATTILAVLERRSPD